MIIRNTIKLITSLEYMHECHVYCINDILQSVYYVYTLPALQFFPV